MGFLGDFWWIPSVNICITMERSTIFNGRTHYFYGHFNSYATNHQRVWSFQRFKPPFLGSIFHFSGKVWTLPRLCAFRNAVLEFGAKQVVLVWSEERSSWRCGAPVVRRILFCGWQTPSSTIPQSFFWWYGKYGDLWKIYDILQEIWCVWLVVGSFLTFPYIGYVIIPTDELIFFRGGETTNQIIKDLPVGFFHVFPEPCDLGRSQEKKREMKQKLTQSLVMTINECKGCGLRSWPLAGGG